MSKCECPIAGWCERHQRTKTPHLHRLCQTDERFRAHWEKATKTPGVAQQAWSYVKAIAKWKLAGSPTRTQEQIDEILNTHCMPCPQFAAKKNGAQCKLCGCRLNRIEDGLKNKIAMATEECPLKKWLAVAP